MSAVPTINFRAAWPGDAAAVREVVRACGRFVRTYSGIRNLDQLYARGHVYIAHDWNAGRIAGFAVCPHLIRKNWSSVYEIGVHPDYQRAGIGRDMITYLLGVSPHRRLRLVCDERNDGGLAFYQAVGFRELGRRQNRSGETIVDLEVTA